MKFLILLKKELRDLLNAQTIISFVVMFFVLFAVNGLTGNIAKEAAASQEKGWMVLDEDRSAFSKDMLASFEREGIKITMLEKEGQVENYIVIPAGFEAGLLNGEPQSIKRVATLKSLSVMESARISGNAPVSKINDYVSKYLAENKYDIKDIFMLTEPVTDKPVTMVDDKSAEISAGELIGSLMSSSVFVPMIVMILTMFSAQMISSAVSNEKTDKTLETLMSTPVTRMEILSSKILSSAIVASVVAAMFTLVMYVSSNMSAGEATGGVNATSAAISELGLSFTPAHYAMLGADILLTVAIALCIALILTIISTDAKSAQMASYPLIILTMLPYLLAIFTDINSLPALPRILMYLIPFTHTFTASPNLLFGNLGLYLFGVGYQILFLCATVFVTVKIFSSDVIFTGIKLKPKKARLSV